MYKIAHIDALFYECQFLRFFAPPSFWRADISDLAACYNGIGPDRWPSRLRRLATEMLEFWESPAFVHDWEYTYDPKTYLYFTMANVRFGLNSSLKAWKKYGVSRIGFRRLFEGWFMALQCQIFGWRGFKTARPPEVHDAR